jgi:hypothetical protein
MKQCSGQRLSGGSDCLSASLPFVIGDVFANWRGFPRRQVPNFGMQKKTQDGVIAEPPALAPKIFVESGMRGFLNTRNARTVQTEYPYHECETLLAYYDPLAIDMDGIPGDHGSKRIAMYSVSSWIKVQDGGSATLLINLPVRPKQGRFPPVLIRENEHQRLVL